MGMTEKQAAETVRRFLAAHPEHIQGVRTDPVHGVVLDRSAVEAFAVWAKTNGGDPAKCDGFVRWLKDTPEGQ